MKRQERRADSRTAPADGLPDWLRIDGQDALIDVHLQPGARRSGLGGRHGRRLKIAIAAPPVEGRANDALVEWLASQLELPRRQVRVETGRRSRDKTLRAQGISAAHVVQRLDPDRTPAKRLTSARKAP